jgi:hypothetical protein
MRSIMADNDIQGHMNILLRVLLSEEWREIWLSFNLKLLTFSEIGLSEDVSDAILWQACQNEQAFLITGNRNSDGADSLDATIQRLNTPTCLPVFTLASPKQVQRSRQHAVRVTVKLLQYLLDIDNYRGAGRLWLP